MMLFDILIVITLTLSSGILSGIETAITAANPEVIINNNAKNISSQQAHDLKNLLKQKEKIITAILVAFTILSTIAIAFTTSIFIELLGKEKGQTVSSILMSIILVVLAEIVPKIIAISHSEVIILKTIRIMKILLILFAPVNYLLEYLTRYINFLLKKKIS